MGPFPPRFIIIGNYKSKIYYMNFHLYRNALPIIRSIIFLHTRIKAPEVLIYNPEIKNKSRDSPITEPALADNFVIAIPAVGGSDLPLLGPARERSAGPPNPGTCSGPR